MNTLSLIQSVLRRHRHHVLNGGSLLVSKVVVYFLYFMAIPPFIAAHGQGAYGLIAFFMTMIGYAVLLESGLSYAVIWRYTGKLERQESQAQTVVQAALPLYAGLAVTVVAAIAFLAEPISQGIWQSPDYRLPIALVGVAVGLMILDAVPASVMQAHNKLLALNINRLIVDVLRVAALYVAIGAANPVMTVISFFLVSALLKLLLDSVYCVYGLKVGAVFWPRWVGSEVWANVKLAPAMFLVAAISLLIAVYDKTFVAKAVSASEYAYYAFAVDVCVRAHILYFAFSGTMYNVLIRRYAGSVATTGLLTSYFIALAVMALGYYLPLSTLGGPVITAFLGEAFSTHAMPLVRILALSSLLYLVFSIFEANLNAMGRVYITLAAYVVGALFLVLVSPHWVRTYGMSGMGYALTVMFGVMLSVVGTAYFLLRTGSSRVMVCPQTEGNEVSKS